LSWAAEKGDFSQDFVSACVTEWMDRIPLPAVAAALYPGLEPFLRWATGTGLRVAALSDYDPAEKIGALGLTRYFSVIVHAHEPEVGVFKPNPKGLRIAQHRLDVRPHEVVYIGDRPEVDGATAVAGGVAGMIVSPKLVQCPPGVELASDWMQIRKLIEARLLNASEGMHA
jgi:HAD superfamily hydrolase (TIGR01549 family)